MWRTGTELPDRWSNGSLCCNFGTCHLLVNVFEPHADQRNFVVLEVFEGWRPVVEECVYHHRIQMSLNAVR